MTDREQNPREIAYDDEIDLRELFRSLWAGKWLISGISGAFAIVAIVVSLMMPNIYRAEALLAPNQAEGASGLSALAAQYGGIASLAGIDIGGSSSDRTTLGLEVLKSRKFIGEFIERHDILVPLMASRSWDWETDRLEIDEDAYDVQQQKWIRDIDPPLVPKPSLLEAYEEFSDRLTVTQDKESGFVRIAFEHYSPRVAQQWVQWLVADLNETIMTGDVREAQQAITYLEDQISKTSLAEMQKVFFSLIEEQTKTVMLAEVSDEYLLKTIDPAVAPEEKTRPKRLLIVLLTTLVSAFLSSVVQIIRNR